MKCPVCKNELLLKSQRFDDKNKDLTLCGHCQSKLILKNEKLAMYGPIIPIWLIYSILDIASYRLGWDKLPNWNYISIVLCLVAGAVIFFAAWKLLVHFEISEENQST